jgi:DNA-binding beta-propeller fold protein YncE
MTRLSALLVSLGCLFFCALAIAQEPPRYKVDPFWPKELPNNWILGQITGIAVDNDNHIWVLNEPRGVPKDDAGAAQTPPLSKCCIPAPAVIEFNAAGSVLKAWGGPGHVPAWPAAPHGICLDKKGNIWIGGVGSPWNPDLPEPTRATEAQLGDRQVLKFSNDGKLLLQIGHPSIAPVNNQDTTLLGAPSAIKVDDAANEVYIADGLMNKRVVVYDSSSGAFKRGWGAYGIPLSKVDNSDPSAFELPTPRLDPLASPSKQFRSLTDIAISDDGLLYATDQNNNRIQVFTKQGKFLKELYVAPKTLGTGSAWGIALSRDPEQRYLFVADGASGVIRILDRRDGTELGKLGHKGRNIGQFNNLAWVALDSQAALYTGEVHFTRSWDGWQAARTGKADTPGGRIQKFLLEK